jgi:hypothetical protein
VNHVADGSLTVTPSRKKASDIQFSVRIIALTPTGIKKRLLHIDKNERSGLR